MPVWAFACKNESSLNRWFDGTDQDVHFTEVHNFSFGSKKLDFIQGLEDYRKLFLKSISSIQYGIGVKILNTYPLNAQARRISDHSDSVYMKDVIDINFSRELLHIDEYISLMDGVNREFEKGNTDAIISFDTMAAWMGSDAQVAEEAIIGDKVLREFVKTILPDVTDQITFTEQFSAKIGGRSIDEYVRIREQFTKELINEVGDESRANPLNGAMLNQYMVNGQSDEVVNVNLIGLTEEIQIILT